MDTSRFKDRKELLAERPDIVAEEAFIQRSREQFLQSDRYKEHLQRKQAGRDIEVSADTSRRAADSADK